MPRTVWCWAFVVACWVMGRAPVRADDPWLGPDKGKHFGASAVLATGGYAASMLVVEEPWQRAALGGGFALTLGVAKELYDATGQGNPSLRDLTWDVIGCVFGAGVSLLVEYALRAPSARQPRAQPARPSAW